MKVCVCGSSMSLPPTLELEDFLLELNQYAQTHDGNVSADLGQQLREYANQVRPSFRRFTSPFTFCVFSRGLLCIVV